jgi:Ca-activated chloride channel family protein
MRSPIHQLLVLLSVLLTAATPAATDDPATPGALRVAGKDGAVVEMPLKHTAVTIEVTAFVARATIEQIFENPFDDPVEAVYTFPLGARAAVDDFEFTVGDRTIRGEIKRREEARQVYETARAAGYQAALLEQERPNVFTQSVANLEPRKPVTVRLRTVETLVYERGLYRLTFPLVVGPRYIPGGVRDAARIAPPVLPPDARSGHDVEIHVTIDAGVPMTGLRSLSHRVVNDVPRIATTASLRLDPSDTIPNKDFLLQWSVSQDRPAVGLLAHRDEQDGFFTFLVQPKGEIGPAEAMPKEITFVVDTSGSMSGIPIEASKRFAAKALHSLGPRDTFNVIRFAGDNEVFSKDALPNDRASIERAIGWLNRAQGGGGTEMLAAMRAAFARPKDENRLRLVVFLTDGEVGNDAQILGEIGRVLGDARIYTVGIGSSVNHHLLQSMAELGRGAYVFVRPDDAANDALEAFRSWVTLPYLTDLTIDWGALPIADILPERLRDLGSGETLTIVGRYLAAGQGDVTVRGKLGGRYWEQSVHVVLPEREVMHAPLASLWARGRIESLLRDADAGVPDSVEAEVTALALSYRLMSPYTSFVAVDDSVVVNPNGNPRTMHQALPMPEGVSFEGIFGTNGPAGLEEKDDKAEPEDFAAAHRGDGARDRDFAVGYAGSGIGGGVAGGVVTHPDGDGNPNVAGRRAMLPAMAPPPPPAATAAAKRAEQGAEKVEMVTVEAERVAGPVATGETLTAFRSDFIQDLPVPGRFYQNVIALSPGVQDERSEGGSPAHSRERLLDAAFRVLADLAYDGKLSASEGRPALAALLAAQRPSGVISGDVATQAVAAWALAEAAAALPNDRWVTKAKTKAIDYLASIKLVNGWPAQKGGVYDPEATRWASLILRAFRPSAVGLLAVPSGTPSKAYAQLRDAIAMAKSGATPTSKPGHSAFERLLASLPKRRLHVV